MGILYVHRNTAKQNVNYRTYVRRRYTVLQQTRPLIYEVEGDSLPWIKSMGPPCRFVLPRYFTGVCRINPPPTNIHTTRVGCHALHPPDHAVGPPGSGAPALTSDEVGARMTQDSVQGPPEERQSGAKGRQVRHRPNNKTRCHPIEKYLRTEVSITGRSPCTAEDDLANNPMG